MLRGVEEATIIDELHKLVKNFNTREHPTLMNCKHLLVSQLKVDEKDANQ